MSKSIIVALFFLFVINKVEAQDVEEIVIGTKHTIYSQLLNEEREYWVNLPEGYNSESSSYKKYPVFIVLDGKAHFMSVSGMVSYLNGIGEIPEMIVVAIQNVDRRRDFTPDKIITVRENNSGGGEKFLGFLEEELIPELGRRYRTAPYRILFGHSLGGLLATHAYMKEKTLFNAFIAVDPSFGTWDAALMDKKLEAVTDNSFNRYIYFATANWGKRNFKNRDRHVRLYEALNNKCTGKFPAKLEYFENESHSSIPVIAFYHGISSIYEGYDISYRDVVSKEQLMQHFQSISKKLSWEIKPPEYLVNRLGYRFLQGGNENEKQEALELFILNTTHFPHSYNAFDSLGEAYQVLGEKDKAIENYRKSLELNPDNENARMKILLLKEKE